MKSTYRCVCWIYFTQAPAGKGPPSRAEDHPAGKRGSGTPAHLSVRSACPPSVHGLSSWARAPNTLLNRLRNLQRLGGLQNEIRCDGLFTLSLRALNSFQNASAVWAVGHFCPSTTRASCALAQEHPPCMHPCFRAAGLKTALAPTFGHLTGLYGDFILCSSPLPRHSPVWTPVKPPPCFYLIEVESGSVSLSK